MVQLSHTNSPFASKNFKPSLSISAFICFVGFARPTRADPNALVARPHCKPLSPSIHIALDASSIGIHRAAAVGHMYFIASDSCIISVLLVEIVSDSTSITDQSSSTGFWNCDSTLVAISADCARLMFDAVAKSNEGQIALSWSCTESQALAKNTSPSHA